MDQDNILIFTDENGEEVQFEIIEETKLVGTNYLLVCAVDSEDNEENNTAFILKEITEDNVEEAIYEIVEDEEELKLIGDIFKELNSDIELY